ncbi:probable WRKY transcription factor 2 [Miscanthus floridulus]|uniref:probable WRKY transcription factor 2 n=1 Tax=Miscanthus floridulus TaxID=154761 RepID=UPI00345B0C65
MEGHVAMEWKDPNPGPESLMSFQTRAVRPDTIAGHSNEDVKAGFEKHGLSVAISSPQEEGRSLPLTPQFGQKTSPGSSLAERMQARTGFKVPKLNMPFSTAAGADNSVPGAPSPYLTIPPGLSPATLLESPVFVSNAMGQPSPTTGKLFMLGGTNDNDPIRFGGPPVGDGPDAFSFKPLDLKSSHYTAEAMKEQNTQSSVKTETKTQPVQEANLLGQLNQQNHNVQTNMNRGGPHDSKLSRLASGAGAGNEHVSPPDYGQTAEEGDARANYPAMAATAPADDGYSWRKYGQKQVKHSEYPRSYFKCTHPNCQVKKKVERSLEGHITEIIYKGAHNHPKPTPSRRPGVQQPVHPFGDTGVQADAGDNNLGSQQANAAEVNHQPWRAGVQDGMDAATSSPSVPGELCDSSASMQVEYAPRGFGSPEGADVTSAATDEVDGDDRVTLGSMSQGGADVEGDELESKRRKLESYAIDLSTASRAVREPRVVIQTTSEVDILDDGYRWRKYGQKVVKGNPNPRSYYKCTHPGCTVRKHVERASHDLKSVITTYEGKHNHEVPAARNNGGHQSTVAAAAATGAGGGPRRPEHPSSVHDCLMMRHLGGCGVPFGLPPPSRDPLAPMGNYPTYPFTALGGGGPTSLPRLPMPAGNLGAVEGLKLPVLATSSPLHQQHPLLRHRQAMQAAALVAAPMADVKVEGNVAGGVTAAPSSVYQQMMRSGLRLGHQM